MNASVACLPLHGPHPFLADAIHMACNWGKDQETHIVHDTMLAYSLADITTRAFNS